MKRLLIAVGLLLSSVAWGQDSAWLVEDTTARRFLDDTVSNIELKKDDQVVVITTEGPLTRVRKGLDVYAWVPSAALTAEAPVPAALPELNLLKPGGFGAKPGGGLTLPKLPAPPK